METNTLPEFVERDPDVIMAESKARLEELLGREIRPAQFEQLMLNLVVYAEVRLLNRFNAGMAQMLYQFSTAPVLDYLAALVAIERLPASAAGCTLRFTLVEGHGTVLIPEGTRVASRDGAAVFRVDDDVIVEPETLSVTVGATAEEAGEAGNGYAAGDICVILDPLAFVSEAANTDLTGGGSDVESDEQLRERIRLAPSQYSSAGSRASYEFYAQSANALVTDVSVTSPLPGTVQIVPLTAEETTPEQVIEDIYAACSAERVRPLTDTVIVASPERQDYTIAVDVTLYENTSAAEQRAEIEARLTAYAAEKRAALGLDIIRSHIAQRCRLESVYDVSVTSPAGNIVIDEGQFPYCTGITVNIIGFNRG